jgi:hypothetical protein
LQKAPASHHRTTSAACGTNAPPKHRPPGSPHSKKLLPPPHEHQGKSFPGSPRSTVLFHFEKAHSLAPNPYRGPTSQPAETLRLRVTAPLHISREQTTPPKHRLPGSPHSKKRLPLPPEHQGKSFPGSLRSTVLFRFEKAHILWPQFPIGSPLPSPRENPGLLLPHDFTASGSNQPPKQRRPGSPHSKKSIPLPPEHQGKSFLGSPRSSVLFHFEKAHSLAPIPVSGPHFPACGRTRRL